MISTQQTAPIDTTGGSGGGVVVAYPENGEESIQAKEIAKKAAMSPWMIVAILAVVLGWIYWMTTKKNPVKELAEKVGG